MSDIGRNFVLNFGNFLRPFLAQGGALAARIPGAGFVQLDSANHVILPQEVAWEILFGAFRLLWGQGPDKSPIWIRSPVGIFDQRLRWPSRSFCGAFKRGNVDLAHAEEGFHNLRLWRREQLRQVLGDDLP